MDSVDQLLTEWSSAVPQADTTPLGVTQRVIRIGRLMEAELQRVVATFGIRVRGDYEVLAALRRAGPLTALALADRVMVSTSAITGRLDRLEEAGMLARVTNPQDRRSVLVSLTDAGLALTEEIFQSSLQRQTEMLGPLSTAEQNALAELLRRLLTDLE